MEHCDFLDKLPLELRFRIYEFGLTFASPIKFWSLIPGSRDLPLLRLNHQIYHEALSVLYERNRILIKYSYFCKNWPLAGRAPIKLDMVKHLLIDGFGPSIVCKSKDLPCDACSPSYPAELIAGLRAFPQLRTAVVNYHGHREHMQTFQEVISESEHFKLVPIDEDSDLGAFKLQGSGLGDLTVEFRWGTFGWFDHAVRDQIDWLQRP